MLMNGNANSMKLLLGFLLALNLLHAEAYIEIDLKSEISLNDGSYLVKEYGGPGRYALISHSHGRFEGSDIAAAACSNGYVVSKLPSKYNKIKKLLKKDDFVLTVCKEDN